MKLIPLADRGPLRVLFAVTSMPVGGAETLLMNLVRRLDRSQFLPEIVCLKEAGPLGDQLAVELPVHSNLLRNKWDVRILGRLRRLICQRRIDALITVGAGDKMFWGRLAGAFERLPVICCALHSTGWPDTIGFLNHRLTAITDAFIAVAEHHGRYLVEHEKFAAEKVCVIPNGIDTELFRPLPDQQQLMRQEMGLPHDAPVVAIVAALRPEKNHTLFLEAAAKLRQKYPGAQFLIVGEGPERGRIEHVAQSLGLRACTHFLGTRADIPRVLSAVDVFALTSHMEAKPVSILEALACGVPVVATRVGSIPEMVLPAKTGYLVEPGNVEQLVDRIGELLADSTLRHAMGTAGRLLVEATGSLAFMVRGYEELIRKIYEKKASFLSRSTASDGVDVMQIQTSITSPSVE
jgi:glycosyltransferase involved in cell wall biosynthesis